MTMDGGEPNSKMLFFSCYLTEESDADDVDSYYAKSFNLLMGFLILLAIILLLLAAALVKLRVDHKAKKEKIKVEDEKDKKKKEGNNADANV